MSHGTPRMRWIGAKVAFPILSNVESRCCLCDCQVHYASFICCRFDGVRSSILAESNGTVVSITGKLVRVELEVLERIRGPEIRDFAIRVEDLCVELACGVYTASMRVSACFLLMVEVALCLTRHCYR